MTKVSVIIPARNEKYLAKTIEEVFSKAAGPVEAIVVLDGATTDPLPPAQPNLKFIIKNKSHGLREAINDAAQKATGKYLLKADAHCIFSPGYDVTLQQACKDNWVTVPRRYWMDSSQGWKVIPSTPADYHYLTFPWVPSGLSLNVVVWNGRNKDRQNEIIDETMGIHGSMWFMHTKYFLQNLEGLNTKNFGYYGEHLEVVLKTWLSGGQVMVNKNTWYAHLQDVTTTDRLWPEKFRDIANSHRLVTKYWINNSWGKQIHNFDWLVDRFWPLPLPGRHASRDRHLWSDNWKDYYEGKI